MPTRLLLEGGDLQELLAQVREEHGTRAKIVSAERVRAGGLTGLLRAERYELTVELSDDEPVEAVVPKPAVRTSTAPSAAGGPVAASQANVTRTAAEPAPVIPPAPVKAVATNATTAHSPAGNGTVGNGAVGNGAVGNGMATTGTAGNGSAGNGMAAFGGAGNGAVGNGAAAFGGTGNGMAGNGMVTGGAVGNGPAGNAGPAVTAPSDIPAIAAAASAGTGEHGPAVDELMALLEMREAATPDSSAVGGPPPGFDAVLAELRGVGGAAMPNGPAANGTANGQANGTPNAHPHVTANGTANGVPNAQSNGTTNGQTNGSPHGQANGAPHSQPNGTPNGTYTGQANGISNGAYTAQANGMPNGTANGTLNGVANGGAVGAFNGQANGAPHGVANGSAHGQTAPPQQVSHVQSAQTPPSAIHSAIESALPAVLRQESTPTSAETVEFSMDPIFAPAKAAPEAPPAPMTARAPGSTARPPSGHNPPAQPAAQAATHAAAQPAAHTAAQSTAQATVHTAPAQSGPGHAGSGHGGGTQGASTQPGGARSGSPQSSSNVGPTSASRATTSRTTANPARTRPLSPDPRRPNHFLSYGDLESIPTDSPLPEKLADLGLPQRVIDRLPLGEAYPSIVRALLDEPGAPPLPSGPGMIITIIGELAGALSVAEDVARILRLDADRILIASESPQVGRHIADPGDAGRQAARLRGGDQPRIVCVDAPAPTAWVQSVVVALRPDAVWCAVDATRKPADVARQLRSLPRVDALAVHALESTADPASPLALGVPVALLDGQPAGPHGWAALLCRRLFEEEFPGGDR